MKAIKYGIKINIDPVHRWGDQIINEIYIPETHVCFNEKGGCFFVEYAREVKGYVDIVVDDDDAIKLKDFCTLQREKEKILSKYF